jgi:hypothetical protein
MDRMMNEFRIIDRSIKESIDGCINGRMSVGDGWRDDLGGYLNNRIIKITLH